MSGVVNRAWCVVRRALRPDLYALALFGSFNPAHEELFSAGQAGTNLAEITADRTCVNVTSL